MQPRKTLEYHKLTSTKVHYLPGEESTAFVGGKLRMPKDLPDAAITEWKRMAKDLHKRGTTTRVDSSAMEAYVRTWALWRKLDAIAFENPLVETTWVDKNGEPHSKVSENPAIKSAACLLTKVLAYQKEFSATPASRDRTRPTQPPVDKNEPPHPESPEGLRIELDRARAAVAAEQALAGEVAEEETVDVGSPADIDRILEAINEEAERNGATHVEDGTPQLPD